MMLPGNAVSSSAVLLLGSLLILSTAVLAVLTAYLLRLRKTLSENDNEIQNHMILFGLSHLDYFVLDSNAAFCIPPHDASSWKMRGGVPVPPEEWLLPEDYPLYQRQISDLVSERRHFVQCTFRVKDGSKLRYFQLYAVKMAGPAGSAKRFFASIQDVTEIREKEKYVEDVSRMLQSVVDYLPYPFFAKDLNNGGRYYAANAALAALTGQPISGILGKTTAELCGLKNSEAIGKIEGGFLKSGKSELETAERYQFINGKDFRCRTFRKLVMLPNGKQVLIGLCIDMAREEEEQRILKNALDKAEELNRAKNVFFASMSHEIRTPLNAIIGFSELLQDSSLGESVQKDYLSSIVRAGNALLALINDVLDLSKLEAGKMPFTPGRCNFSGIVRETGSIFEQQARAKGLDFIYEIAPMPDLFLDKLRFRQILLNLIGNALKFTAKGRITLHAGFTPENGESGTLSLSVRDTGTGISEEDQKKLFEPFVQGKAMRGTYAEHSGTGLGLAIVRRMITQMGGSVRVESRLGEGSEFIVTLSRVRCISPEAKEPAPAAAIPVEKVSGSGLCVLVVDDVRMNVTVMAALLKKLGISVLTASGGAEAMRVLDSSRVDMLLTDLWMPGMNGADLARRLRGNPRDASMRFIAVTADAESRSNFDMSVFDEVLTKPVSFEKIATLFRSADSSGSGTVPPAEK